MKRWIAIASLAERERMMVGVARPEAKATSETVCQLEAERIAVERSLPA